jgi:hypothetical protein
MAIDFMVMPFSRYLAGDFITPAMRYAWSRRLPYTIIGPGGRRELPEGQPFGGPTAAARRSQFIPMLAEDLALLPAPLSRSWDENSVAEPRFHRVDPQSYQSLLELSPHLRASVFLPIDFAAPFEMTSPFERLIGSVPRALEELARPLPPAAASAARTLEAALADARELQLPLIVDW